ncbi:hypothetical protein K469DRAFT_681558 [Zopfia rhizophila CBS 207.26]|uniref:Uncharacterized protein n=1 Tax=Zopfia rhizophila CBS 207.26 TaxID=1314779 RepID=A0A6A6EYL5_9PEZI|nr:hypothetical protein K469DRAFT_681558 [Zopfia rhizophila CBS 207.26]
MIEKRCRMLYRVNPRWRRNSASTQKHSTYELQQTMSGPTLGRGHSKAEEKMWRDKLVKHGDAVVIDKERGSYGPHEGRAKEKADVDKGMIGGVRRVERAPTRSSTKDSLWTTRAYAHELKHGGRILGHDDDGFQKRQGMTEPIMSRKKGIE